MRKLPAILVLVLGCQAPAGAGPKPRVVSLNPGATEVLFAIGAGEHLVGRSRFDDYPPEVREVRVVGDLLAPDLELVASLRPDFVIISMPMQAQLARQLVALGLDTVDFSPESVEELLSEMVRLGRLVGREGEARRLVDSLRSTLPGGSPGVSVFVELSRDPLYTAGAGSLVGDAVTRAGGRNVFQEEGYFPVKMEEVLVRSPEAVVVAHPGEPAPWPRDIRVIRVDPDMLNRPGPRLFSAIAQLHRALSQ